MDQLMSIRRRIEAGRAATARDGFTLLEVTIAMVILAIGMLTMTGAQLHAMRGGQAGRHTSGASAIAQSQMEQLQRARWLSPALVATAPGWTAPVVVNSTIATNGGPAIEMVYNVNWRITDIQPGELKGIDIQVVWNEPNRGNRTYYLSSGRYNHEGL